MAFRDRNVFGYSRNAPLFTMLYQVVLTLESVNEILMCDPIHMKANEQYFPQCGAVHYAVNNDLGLWIES